MCVQKKWHYPAFCLHWHKILSSVPYFFQVDGTDARPLKWSYIALQTVIGAVRENDVVLLEQLIKDGADVNAPDEDGNVPIIVAATRGRADIVQILLDAGADPNARGPTGIIALHVAAFFGHTEVVQLLLLQDTNVDERDDEGFTALHLASQEGFVEVVVLLLDAGADINIQTFKSGGTALSLAVTNVHVDIVRLLLDRGADPTIGSDGDVTLLMHACTEVGTEEIVKLLIDAVSA